MSGIYLVDQEASTRAGPLFSEAGDCVCSTNLGFIEPGGSQPIFAKFPLPAGAAEQVDVILPGFQPVDNVPISGSE